MRWLDGDTFRFLEGPRRGERTRLEGYNTLESYGPVQRWGGWTAAELLQDARAATEVARAGAWRCTSRGRYDRYRRLLVACPDLAAELVRAGHAMVFAIGAPADPTLLALQRRAQREGAGMWAKGVPPRLVAGLHSVAEGGGRRAYDRIVDTTTGEARAVAHGRAYRTCEEVCVGSGDARACMVYVPFARQHRGRPPCLRP